MTTGLPVLERERAESRDLRAYGKLAGREENTEMTEDQKALRFNSRISDNYQKLINPDYKKAEDFGDAGIFDQPVDTAVFERDIRPAVSAPIFQSAPAAAPVAERPAAMNFAAAPVFETAAPAFEAEAPAIGYEAPAYDGYAEQTNVYAEEEADLMPTSTTIQYRSDLFENEKPTVTQEKKSYALTSKGKLLMAVYALVVAVILALIIINTSVLRTLDKEVGAQEARLSQVMSDNAAKDAEISELTSDEYIINWAENNGYVHL